MTRIAAAAAILLAVLAGPAAGEEVLRGENVVVRYPANRRALAEETVRIVVAEAPGIAEAIGLARPGAIVVDIAGDTEHYRRLHRGILPEWSAAFSRIDRGEIGLDASRLADGPRSLSTILRHEIAHVLFAQRTGGAACPTWFLEGVAMRLSREWGFGEQLRLARLLWRYEPPLVDELEGRFPRPADEASLAYGLSYLAVMELLNDRPDDLRTVAAFIEKTGDFDEAFASTFGEPVDAFALRLDAVVRKRYRTGGAFVSSASWWTPLAFLFLLAWAVRRRRNRRRLAAWEADEAAARGPSGADGPYSG
ncbi:MAG: hypothetical protein JW876_02925 [Candidatus Krumholzibacteriota bacterium]|nr:hypothetical protein [Candidatus Krumholzibacteriota bacterium]